MNPETTARMPLRRTALQDESGTAAIEFALLLPFMLLLFLGMVQLTALLSVKTKLSSAATVMADLVTRHNDLIKQAELTEYFRAVELVMSETARPDTGVREVRTRVFAYRFDGTSNRFIVAWSWQGYTARGANLACSPPEAADIRPLAMNADGTAKGLLSDLFVVVTCTRYTFPVPSVPFLGPFTEPDIDLRQQIIMRPRAYLKINCADCTGS